MHAHTLSHTGIGVSLLLQLRQTLSTILYPSRWKVHVYTNSPRSPAKTPLSISQEFEIHSIKTSMALAQHTKNVCIYIFDLNYNHKIYRILCLCWSIMSPRPCKTCLQCEVANSCRLGRASARHMGTRVHE